MVRINGLFHLLISGIYRGNNPVILTFDPDFRPRTSKHVPGSMNSLHYSHPTLHDGNPYQEYINPKPGFMTIPYWK